MEQRVQPEAAGRPEVGSGDSRLASHDHEGTDPSGNRHTAEAQESSLSVMPATVEEGDYVLGAMDKQQESVTSLGVGGESGSIQAVTED